MRQEFLEHIFTGSQLLMLAYSLFFFFAYRNKAFALFALVAFVPLGNIILRQVSGVDSTDFLFEKIRWSLVFSGYALGAAYIKSILDMRELAPHINRIFNYVICVCVAAGIVDFFMQPSALYYLVLLVCLSGAVVMSYGAYKIRFYYRHLCPFIYYTAGASALGVVIDAYHMLSDKEFSPAVAGFYLLVVLSAMFSFSILNIIQVITVAAEREESRLMVEQKQKMAALGEVASTIAHEVKNPLAALIYAVDLQSNILQSNVDDKAKLIKMNQTIEKTAKQINKIVSSLDSISRHPANDPIDVVSVKRIIEKTIDLFTVRLRHSTVQLQVGKIPEDLTIECRESQICQVLLNLLNNAYDAVQLLEEQWIRVDSRGIGDRVFIWITDSGKGIEPKIQERILETFFTTKEKGKGTGLGLNICKSILSQHDGSLRLATERENTTFEINLPRRSHIN